jgi:hypothetical protein
MIIASTTVIVLLSGGLLVSISRGGGDDAGRTGAAAVPASSAARPPATVPARRSPSSAPGVTSAATPTPEATAMAPDSRIGVAIPAVRLLYDAPATLRGKLDRVAGLGAGWLRFDAAWPEIEYEKGRFDFARVDRAVNEARARDLQVILIFGGTAAWARPATAQWNHGPVDRTARAGFTAFVTAAAKRYRGKIGAYEIWNEPNLPGAWAPRPDPAAYRALLADAYPAIHRADPGAVVLSGGTGGGSTGVDTLRWYTALYQAGLASISDGVAVHPYPDALHPAGTGEMARAKRVRSLMDAHGDRDKQLWGTETGTATGGAHAASEKAQAGLVEQLLRQWRGIHTVGPLMYYTLYDFGGADREDHFGLLRADGSAKPAYASLRDQAIR